MLLMLAPLGEDWLAKTVKIAAALDRLRPY